MNENDFPTIDDDLRLPDEESSRAAVVTGAVFAGAANTASAMFGLFRRRVPDEESEMNELAREDEMERAETLNAPEIASPIDEMKTEAHASNNAFPSNAAATAPEADEIPIRVSAKAPRAKKVKTENRSRGLAESLLDGVVAQVGDYVESSPAVERLIQTQVAKILGELAHDQGLAILIRAQAEDYIEELGTQPEKLDPVVNAVAGRYLDQLATQPEKLDPLVNAIAGRYITRLQENPAELEPLVNAIAGRYIARLHENPSEVEPLVIALAGRYITRLQENSAEVQPLVQALAGWYITRLQANPAEVEPLVQALAGRYIGYLQNHPDQMMPLVQTVGDEYIDYLLEHPDAVQELIQGQSLSLAGVVMEDVRARAATTDTILEIFARNLFRRAPRHELPEPSPEVQALAERKPMLTLHGKKKRDDE